MKSLDECKDYFESNIMSHAVAAEKERKKFVGYWLTEMAKTVFMSVVLIIAGIVLSSNVEGDGSIVFLLFLVAPVIGSIIWIAIKIFTLEFKYLEKLEEFRRYYRKHVTKPVVEFMLPELSYKPEEGIDTETIEKSLIVPIYFTQGDAVSKYLLQPHDLLEGEFNGVVAQASMLSLERRADRVQCDPLGGLFFHAKLKSEFKGRVVIRREFTKEYLGEALSDFVGDARTELDENNEKMYFNEMQNNDSSEQLNGLESYHIDDKGFENYYCIKTTDTELAKKLLTDKRISKMLDIAKDGNFLVQFSFFDSCFSAYFFRDNSHLFDVALIDVKKKVDNLDNMLRIYNELSVLNLMVAEMLGDD